MKEQITKLQGKVDRLDRWWRDCVHRREPYQVFVKDELDKAKAELAQIKSEWADLQEAGNIVTGTNHPGGEEV